MIGARSGHSRLGIASFVLSFVPPVLLVGLVGSVVLLVGTDPPGDEVAYGFGLFMAALMIVLGEVVALVLGIAGTLQRRRKRLFASLGLVCSVVVLVFASLWWVFAPLWLS